MTNQSEFLGIICDLLKAGTKINNVCKVQLVLVHFSLVEKLA